MHIPDGFLDLKTSAATAALAVGGVGWAIREANLHLPPARRPLMGLAAAFIFAAQMINFPVWGGTSGHLIGSVLAAVLVGPAAAVVVMSAVLIVQCLLFNDGGLIALGANLFNMALVAPIAGGAIYHAVANCARGDHGRLMAAMFASWCSTVLEAFCCAAQLAFSGTTAWTVVMPAMVNIHMLIGLGEGAITGLILMAILRTRPELLRDRGELKTSLASWGIPAFLICAGIALFLSPHASAFPDGLEKVAEHLGFSAKAGVIPAVASPLVDYKMPGISSAIWSTGIAGLMGTCIAFLLSWGFARWATVKTASNRLERNPHP